MSTERTPDDIQRDIERARASLAVAVDQLAHRTNPKRLSANLKQSLTEKARTPQGQAILGGVGVLFAIIIVRKIAKH